MTFNPEITHSNSGLFGLPHSKQQSQLWIINCPWEVTTSYGGGTSKGPKAILNASPQLDLFTLDQANHYEKGYHLLAADKEIQLLNDQLKPMAQGLMEHLEKHAQLDANYQEVQSKINTASSRVNELIYQQAKQALQQNKLVSLIGGDHSSPYGLIKALSEKYDGHFGVLHIDAHHDLRVSYQGFHHSHASIMHNVLQLEKAPSKLIQVGIRDFCKSEHEYAYNDPVVQCYYDQNIKDKQFHGESWKDICQQIIQKLPENIYVSFDIDGLSPEYCPSTGTPVPGGLTYSEADFLLKEMVRQDRNLIGFDLCEVAPSSDHPNNEWDANVGARVLLNLCNLMIESLGH